MSDETAQQRKPIYRVLKTLVLLSLGLAFLASPAFVREVTQFNALNTRAETLLDDSLDRNLVTFVSVSAIKAVMALVEGSSVGVGFDLEVGDLIQPAYDYIDFVWRIFLYALMALSFYKLLMETGLLGTGFAFIGAGLLLGAFASLNPKARRWARMLMLLGILLSYILPAALISTHYVSEVYLTNVKAANAERIEGVRDEFAQARDDVLDLREKLSILRPGESIETIRTESVAIATRLSDAVWTTMFAFLSYVLILMVELVLLPLLSAFILYKIAATLTRQASEGMFDHRKAKNGAKADGS